MAMNKMSSGKTTKMNERKTKKPNMTGKTSEGNIGMDRSTRGTPKKKFEVSMGDLTKMRGF